MEIEFKFCIPFEQLQALEAAMRQGPVQRTRLQARYFDTPDHALAAQGMVLRLRKEGPRWVQTAKAAGEGVLKRLEHNVDLGLAPMHTSDGDANVLEPEMQPQPDPARHAGTPVGERLLQLLARSGQTLQPTYGTDIWRLSRTVEHSGCSAELALDLGEIYVPSADGSPPRSTPVRELELELLSGSVQGLTALAQQWAGTHGLWFSTVSKAEAGLRLVHRQTLVPAVPALSHVQRQRAPAPSTAALRIEVAACLAHVLPNASEIAAGNGDATHVQQLSMGLRQLRQAVSDLAQRPLDQRERVAGTWGATQPMAQEGGMTWDAALTRALGALNDGHSIGDAAAASPMQPVVGNGTGTQVESSIVQARAAQAIREPNLQAALIALIGFSADGESSEDGVALA